MTNRYQYPCLHDGRGIRRCSHPPLRNSQYCRWHSIYRAVPGAGSGLRTILAGVYVVPLVGVLEDAARLNWLLLTQPSVERLAGVVLISAFAAALLSLALMLLDRDRPAWAMIYAIALPVVGVGMSAVGIVAIAWPSTRTSIERVTGWEFSPSVYQFGFPIVLGCYVLILFATNVLFLDVSAWFLSIVVILLVLSYLLMFSIGGISFVMIALVAVTWTLFILLNSPELRDSVRTWFKSWG